MRNPLAIFVAIVVAGACSEPVLNWLENLVLPPGQHLMVLTPTEPLAALAWFMLSLCACFGLAAAVVCYLRSYSVPMRWAVAFVPMSAAGFLAALLKAAQFHDARSVAGTLGIPPAFSLQQASFHTVPAAAFVAGSLAVAVAVVFRTGNGQPTASPNRGPAVPPGDSGTSEEPPSAG